VISFLTTDFELKKSEAVKKSTFQEGIFLNFFPRVKNIINKTFPLTGSELQIHFLCALMSLITASLNSGSNGNCYYVGNGEEAVLVDAGISCRETEKRMKRLSLNIHKVKAIFISHEHSDHIRGVEVLSKKYKVPVYITEKTLKNGRLKLDADLVRSFRHKTAVSVGGLTITPFSKSHDAVDPYSFTIDGNSVRIAVITDIGTACNNVIEHFRLSHAAYLEANYDEELLENGAYPVYLKRRISSDQGHLSNHQALQLFLEHRPEFMSHLFLSHLSQDNNSPQLVQKMFGKHAGATKIIVASRHYETDVHYVSAGIQSDSVHAIAKAEQMSLF
jgi:phosphoribosyl 1,2-cyclic phosphodiesterase